MTSPTFPQPVQALRTLCSVLAALLTCAHAAAAEPLVTPTAQTVKHDGITFTLPQQMRLERIAAPPLIRWPIAAAWDADGDLLVLECDWNGQSVHDQLETRPHRVVRLIDSDQDGTFDRRQVAAEGLSFPEGILVHQGALFVAAPPVILRLEDKDGDGVYEQRETWFDGGTLTHCANDLHGPMLGRDGWIYWTKGAFAEQTLETRDGGVLTSRASHIYRRHPAGGGVETIISGGMDNPVDLAFLPDGERVFCSTFLHHPGDGRRDGIAHAIYGGLFGKQHQVLDGHLRTGPLLDPIAELGPAAPAAVLCLTTSKVARATSLFDKDELDASFLVSAQFNLQKLGIHRLIEQGASFTTQSHDLLAADRVDFHPVDVLEDRGGDLIVIDTGGWYDLCCPSSGVDGQVAPGGIYRLSMEEPASFAASEPPQSDLSLLQWHLKQLLSSSARERSLSSDWLLANAAESRAPLQQCLEDDRLSVTQRLEAFWCLARVLVEQPDQAEVKQTVLTCLDQEPVELQRASAQIVSLYRWEEAANRLLKLVESGSPALQRLAVECLGRIEGEEQSVHAALLQAASRTSGDRALEHAIVYALMERNRPDSLRPYLSTGSPREQWVALMVLNQTRHIRPADADVLLALAESTDPSVQQLAVAVLAERPDFAAQSLSALSRHWHADDEASLATVRVLINNWWRRDDVSLLMAAWLRSRQLSLPQSRALIGVLAQVQGDSLPTAWVGPVADWLAARDPAVVLELAQSLQGVKWSMPRDQPIVEQLLVIANDATTPHPERLACVTAMPPRTSGVAEGLLRDLIDGVTGQDERLAGRSAEALARVRLTVPLAKELTARLQAVGPMHLQAATLAILSAADPVVDAQLLEALSQVPHAKSLTSPRVLAALADRSTETQQAWAAMFEQLHAPPQNISSAVDVWLAKLPAGNPVDGHQVFRSSQAACSSCHQVGYVGGKVGPELTRIGKSRTRRDLAEAILFPSARLEQSYRPWQVLTTDGRVINGFIERETDTQLELICGVDSRCVVTLDDVERRQPSDISLMPAGLEQSLTLQQLADLLAFLESAR